MRTGTELENKEVSTKARLAAAWTALIAFYIYAACSGSRRSQSPRISSSRPGDGRSGKRKPPLALDAKPRNYPHVHSS